MAESTLQTVRGKVEAFAAMMAEILKLDVEIVDDAFVRVAGTGDLRDDARLVADGAVYRQIFRSGKPALIHNPRKNELCAACAHKDRCLEKLEICYPIQVKGRVIGAVGMTCSSSFEKKALMENIRMYIGFIDKVCAMLTEAIVEANAAAQMQAANEDMRAAIARYAEEGYSGDVCTLETLEMREIEKALRQFGNDTKGKKEAANALGIGMATLYRKLGNVQDIE